MKCKGCSKDLTGLEYRDVAEWHFCLDCFQKLLEQKAHQEDLPQLVSNICQVCQTEIEPGQGQQLLGLLVCEQCKKALLQKPEIKLVSRPEEELPEEVGVEQVPVDIRKTIHCAGCNRLIPELGSKEIDGKPYCPDCYQKLSRQEQVVEPAKQEAGICQACQKVIGAEGGKAVSGFLLCQACLETDPVAALEIARARHQQELARIKKELQL